jgi:hypothetical protein
MNIRKPSVNLPKAMAENGFVSDLQTELQQVADRFKPPLYAFRKNGRYWFALPIPTETELPTLDPP